MMFRHVEAVGREKSLDTRLSSEGMQRRTNKNENVESDKSLNSGLYSTLQYSSAQAIAPRARAKGAGRDGRRKCA
jgi:hypothetical protein